MRLLSTTLPAVLMAASSGMADQRPWVWIYGSAMMHRGEAELEHYMTVQSPDWTRRAENLKTVHQVELEIGMSERLDAAIYQVFSRTPASPLDWNGYKVRLRWRLTETPDAFGHPILYLEHKNNATLSKSVWETKLLLSQSFGPVDLAINPVAEFDADETTFSVNAGASLPVLWHLKLGAELRASKDAVYLGPTLSHGGPGLWSALGVSWRVGEIDPGDITHQVRLIIGVQVKD
ncbi:MAG: hypothetical protein Q8O14_00525 [bacterium]|nr:hypothetical protein [bacterium]